MKPCLVPDCEGVVTRRNHRRGTTHARRSTGSVVHIFTVVHRKHTGNSQRCSSGDSQASACTMNAMTPEQAYEISYEPGTNVTTFAMPASYEDMQYLDLDPLTGQPMEVNNGPT